MGAKPHTNTKKRNHTGENLNHSKSVAEQYPVATKNGNKPYTP